MIKCEGGTQIFLPLLAAAQIAEIHFQTSGGSVLLALAHD